jgi:enamidase
VGRSADFVLIDRAQHSAGTDVLDSIAIGDLPGISMVIIDGVIRCRQSRNTPPAETLATLESEK